MAVPAVSSEASVQEVWEKVGAGPGSWYLDPLVAEQKRRLNAALLAAVPRMEGFGLKTDSFEEAFGADSPLQDLLPYAERWLVMDRAQSSVHRARLRFGRKASFVASDIRHLGLGSATLDLIFSNSTLDHFERREDFEQ